MTWTLAGLENTYPLIKWRMPIKTHWLGGNVSYVCRVCIANHGLKKDSDHQWPSAEECERHIRQKHIKENAFADP